MGVEIEAKMKVDRFDEVLARLSECSAVFVGDELETNQFFDTPTAALRAAKKGLRLRVARDLRDPAAPPTAFVTFKGPLRAGQFKSREEIEIIVDKPVEAAALLGALGFGPNFSFEKRRRTWTLRDCKVELDEVPYLGTFVEIEGPGEQAISEIRQMLGLTQHASITESYIGMLVEYLRTRGIKEMVVKLQATP